MIVDILDNWTIFAIVLGGALLSAFLLWMIVISKNHHYTHSDVQAHSSDYGYVIREGHGPMLLYLWVIFISVIIFVIVYWIVSWPSLTTMNTF